MKRLLFCNISPLTYKISEKKCILLKKIKNLFILGKFAVTKTEEKLEHVIYKHNSLIRRTLGNVEMYLQENKAVNLELVSPKINKTIIKSGEIFSFWNLVGDCNEKKGFKEGLTIKNGGTSHDIGGGVCQFTNLIHWLVLHTDMDIIEHHHHDQIDLFPDFNRQIPFGTGTSIMYNYLDYMFKNNTTNTYQLITYTTSTHLCGEMRAIKAQPYKYHIAVENEFFSKETNGVYRNGKVYRKKIDKKTGDCVKTDLIRDTHAKVNYDTANLDLVDLT